MLNQLLPFITGILTIYAMWLAGSKKWQGWLVGLLNQGFWLATVIVFETWGLLPLTIFLTVTYARNLLRWRRESGDQNANEEPVRRGSPDHINNPRRVERSMPQPTYIRGRVDRY